MRFPGLLVFVFGLASLFEASAHEAGTTGFASITISGNMVRYELTMSSIPASPLAEDMGLNQADGTPRYDRFAEAIAENIHLTSDGTACEAGPRHVVPPTSTVISVAGVVDFICAGTIATLTIRDDMFDVMGTDVHTLANIQWPDTLQQFAFSSDSRVLVAKSESGPGNSQDPNGTDRRGNDIFFLSMFGLAAVLGAILFAVWQRRHPAARPGATPVPAVRLWVVAAWLAVLGLGLIVTVIAAPNRLALPPSGEDQAARGQALLLPVPIEQIRMIDIVFRSAMHRFERDQDGAWFYHAHANASVSDAAHVHQTDPAVAERIDRAFSMFGRARMQPDTTGAVSGLNPPEMIVMIFGDDLLEPRARYLIGDIAPDLVSRFVMIHTQLTVVMIPDYQVENLIALIESVAPAAD